MPCNFHLRGLAEHVKEGVRAAGGTPMEFNTVAISDGITMGTQGMKASLVSREVIADSIELMARGYQFDAIVALSACDKTIPGCVMALARLDVPSVMLYGGSIAPGRWHGKDVTIVDVFEAIGAHAAGKMSDEELTRARERRQPRRRRLRRPVHRQHDGLRLRGPRDLAGRLGDGPGRRRREEHRRREDRRAGHAASSPTTCGRARSSPATRSRTRSPASAPRAARPTASCTCSRSPARPGSSSTSTTSSGSPRGTPLLADLKPGGRFVATDLYRAGGVPLILKRLAEAGMLHGDAITVTGRTIGEEADGRDGGGRARRSSGRSADPLKPEGGLAILRGNLAPRAPSSSSPAPSARSQTGPARVFECEEDCFRAVKDQKINPGDVDRDPQRGPGRRSRHARDAPGHRRASSARAWARTSRCSPTAASPARPAA